MTFDKIDIYVDLTYGVLIAIGMASMMLLQHYIPAVTFGVGLMFGYMVHIGWRMARFDPEVTEQIEETVEETVEQTVEETVEDKVGETVEESVGEMQEQVEETVEETVEDAVNGN